MATSSKVFAALAFALVAAFAYVSVFGFASVYDDEGYNVAVTRLVSEGVPLYTGQFGIHGPLPYLVRALVLKALGVAVTHQSVRLWVWGMWLLSATALALAIRNLTGSRFFAIGSLIVVGTHLFPLRFNPGHPEDFIVLFLSLAVLVALTETPWLGDGLRVAMLGLIGAALLGTKINVGAFYVLGLSAWDAGVAPARKAVASRFCLVPCGLHRHPRPTNARSLGAGVATATRLHGRHVSHGLCGLRASTTAQIGLEACRNFRGIGRRRSRRDSGRDHAPRFSLAGYPPGDGYYGSQTLQRSS